MQAEQPRNPINFSNSFEKTVSHFDDLSETKKRDLELLERLDAQRNSRGIETAS
jgi:hypothetical protein